MTSGLPDGAPRKITVIANCHTGPLAQMLAFHGAGLDVDGIYLDQWHNQASECREKADRLTAAGDRGGLVFSFNVTENFGALNTANLRSLFGANLLTFTNIRFDGLHPDTTYFGSFGGRWGNFLSEYHSKIVLHSYAAGRGVKDCLRLFNGATFETLGYFDVFAASEAELRRRDEACDIKFCDAFIALARAEFCLMTINHPTSIVFNRLARMLCEKTDIRFLEFDPRLYPNPLVQSVIWPIYNEVAEALSLRYRTPQYFIRPPDGWMASMSRGISMEDFIAGSYRFYEAHFAPDQFRTALGEMDPDNKFRDCLA